MKYFDSHAHYWDDAFKQNGESADQLIDALFSRDVAGIVNVGTSPKTSLLAREQAEKHPGMEYAAGIHPNDAEGLYRDMEEVLTFRRIIPQMFLNARSSVLLSAYIGEFLILPAVYSCVAGSVGESPS